MSKSKDKKNNDNELLLVSGNHLSAVPVGGKVFATGKLIHRGRSSHIWNIDITTPQGQLVSTVRVVNFILKKK